MQYHLGAILALVLTASALEGYDDELYCPPGTCLRVRDNPQWTSPERIYHYECFDQQKWYPSIPKEWGPKVPVSAKQSLLDRGYTNNTCHFVACKEVLLTTPNIPGSFVPVCEEDGMLFKEKQCKGSTGTCWCVDPRSGMKKPDDTDCIEFERDEHGCLVRSEKWCEKVQACLNPSYEECAEVVRDEHGCAVNRGEEWCEVTKKCYNPNKGGTCTERVTDAHGCLLGEGELWCPFQKKCIKKNEDCTLFTGKDNNGCHENAGYRWCEVKQRCVRPWQEPCNELVDCTEALEKSKGVNSPYKPQCNGTHPTLWNTVQCALGKCWCAEDLSGRPSLRPDSCVLTGEQAEQDTFRCVPTVGIKWCQKKVSCLMPWEPCGSEESPVPTTPPKPTCFMGVWCKEK
eukprot:Sspe_Gene.54113::Locus_29878_Transcript_1_1_Confidence_1.000_Length_1266::g.54113::m.54113